MLIFYIALFVSQIGANHVSNIPMEDIVDYAYLSGEVYNKETTMLVNYFGWWVITDPNTEKTFKIDYAVDTGDGIAWIVHPDHMPNTCVLVIRGSADANIADYGIPSSFQGLFHANAQQIAGSDYYVVHDWADYAYKLASHSSNELINELMDCETRGDKIVFTGHSMGGAAVTFLAMVLDVGSVWGWKYEVDRVVTFGAPRLVDGHFGSDKRCPKRLQDPRISLRIVQSVPDAVGIKVYDPAPHQPPSWNWMYEEFCSEALHVSPDIFYGQTRTTALAKEDSGFPILTGNPWFLLGPWTEHRMFRPEVYKGMPGTYAPSYYFSVLWASGNHWKSKLATCCEKKWRSPCVDYYNYSESDVECPSRDPNSPSNYEYVTWDYCSNGSDWQSYCTNKCESYDYGFGCGVTLADYFSNPSAYTFNGGRRLEQLSDIVPSDAPEAVDGRGDDALGRLLREVESRSGKEVQSL